MTGYFGKVSTLGDFVSRGLPDALVAAWDAWLQQCIHASRQQLGDKWLDRYLTSPVWRFAIAPGILGPEGLGGVMMPSVDRVGRYFPLMIGATGAPPLLDWYHKHADWYDAIEDLARASLDPAFRLTQFDQMLDPRMPVSAPPLSVGQVFRLDLNESLSKFVVDTVLVGHSLWWTDAAPEFGRLTLVCKGMPQALGFAEMLIQNS